MRTRWTIIRAAAKWAGLVLLVLVLYVGSAGPVSWLYVNDHIPSALEPLVKATYSPVVTLDVITIDRLPHDGDDRIHVVVARQNPLDNYIDWWCGDLWPSP